jgi:Rhodopirellula transposase DDE domain
LAAPATGGDPMTEDRFVRVSLRHLSDQLRDLGHRACPTTVAAMLRELGYNLRVNVKRLTGPPHPDRDRQFRYIQSQLKRFGDAGLPILSVDAKKKELVGNFANAGRAWVLAAFEVNAHDFRTDAVCRAVPYGLYDVLANRGHVVVGESSDTPAFAAEAVASWWVRYGCKRYRGAGELLILADSGGSNGCRPRLWKQRLQGLVADAYGLEVTVCHYPRGASKWNPVEHRLFSAISSNWRGMPLRTPGLMLSLIRGTTTSTGLVVTAEWTGRTYERGIKVTDAEMQELWVEHHETCPDWNYTIKPRCDDWWARLQDQSWN